MLVAVFSFFFATQVPNHAVINVCGDIHGQFYDLLKIFREKGTVKRRRSLSRQIYFEKSVSGPPSDTNLYLFNGDIVDKGPMSLECVLYLFLLKLSRPNQVRNSKKKNHLSLLFSFSFFFPKMLHLFEHEYRTTWVALTI